MTDTTTTSQTGEEALNESLNTDTQIDETEALKKEIHTLKEQILRIQADQQNMSKRMEKERQEMSVFLLKNLVLKILPFIDNLDRALKAVPSEKQDDSWIQGISAIYTGMLRQLEQLGVIPFDSVGSPMDENKHEVLSMGNGPANQVILECERGFMLHDTVLRYAKVVVGNGQETNETTEE